MSAIGGLGVLVIEVKGVEDERRGLVHGVSGAVAVGESGAIERRRAMTNQFGDGR
jgi:hypothetical protein